MTGKSKGKELMPSQKMKDKNSEDADERHRVAVFNLLAASEHEQMKKFYGLR